MCRCGKLKKTKINIFMETIQIAREVISNLQESFDKETRDEIGKSFLKIIADKFGTEFISECITQHPNKGYTVRYLDDFAPKMIAEQHKSNLKSNNDLIKNILSENSNKAPM
jgi:hypothetical protein